MASRQRPSPPSYGRRMIPPERSSTGTFGPYPPSSFDPYYGRDARDTYPSPRTSGERVIPVSTETYRNGSLVSSNRHNSVYEPYNDPWRAGLPLGDTIQRKPAQTSSSTSSAAPGRDGTAVIHQNLDRSAIVGSKASDRHERSGSYVTPVSSSGRREHRKTYSIDDGRRARLGDDRGRDDDYGRGPRRRDARYHLTGPTKRSGQTDDDAEYEYYEYADPRDVFEFTEPRRQTRRRGSVDAPRRDRPNSLIESYVPTNSGARDVGPPRATRDLERVSNTGGVSRHESLSGPVRSPQRHKVKPGNESNSEEDDYRVTPRPRRNRPGPDYYDREPPYSPTRNNFEERRDSLRPPRKFEDVDVANRGFGIRAASVDPPLSRDENVDSRNRYAAEPPPPPPDYPPDVRRDDRKWETEKRHRDRGPEHDRDYDRDYDREKDRNHDNGYDRDYERDYDREGPREREVDTTRRRERDATYDRAKEAPPSEDEPKSREHHYAQERERDRHPPEAPRTREKNIDDGSDASRRDRPRDDGRQDDSSAASLALPVGAAAAAGTAAYFVGGATQRKEPQEDRSVTKESKEKETKTREERSVESPDETITRERHYVTRDDNRNTEDTAAEEGSAAAIDPDEEFRQRVQQEANRVKQSKPANHKEDADPPRPREPPRRQRDADDLESDEDEEDTSRALAVQPKSANNILDAPLSGDAPAAVIENRENRVRIVEPPKEKDMPRGILRKPTEKFPEYPNTTREGVAPHKDAKKEGVPEGAKWTKIARSMVNPQALKEAEERFEERQDFVIVLRAISKEEIQKLADRTQEIREEREHRHHRDRRQHRRWDHEDEDDGYDR